MMKGAARKAKDSAANTLGGFLPAGTIAAALSDSPGQKLLKKIDALPTPPALPSKMTMLYIQPQSLDTRAMPSVAFPVKARSTRTLDKEAFDAVAALFKAIRVTYPWPQSIILEDNLRMLTLRLTAEVVVRVPIVAYFQDEPVA